MKSRYYPPSRSAILPILFVFFSAGCTTQLRSEKIEDYSKLSTGQVYYLPRAEYQVTVTRELKSCMVGFDSEADAAVAWLAIQLPKISTQETIADQVAFVRSIESDPVIRQPDVRQSLIGILGTGSPSALLLPAGTTAFSPGEQRRHSPPSQTAPKVDQNALGDAMQKLDASGPTIKLKLEAAMTAAATPSWVPDGKRAFTLDYTAMQDGLKATDYAVESYPNGTLKSVNVTIDDQTGPVILSVLGGVAKLAAASGGFPLQAVTQTQHATTKPFQSFKEWKATSIDSAAGPCTKDVTLKLYQRAGLESQADSNAETLLVQQKKVDKLDAAQVEAIAVQDKAKAALKEIDSADPKRPDAEALVKKTQADAKLASKATLDAKVELADMNQAAAKISTRLAAVRKALTVMHSTTFQPELSTRFLKMPGATEALQAWIAPDTQKSCSNDISTCKGLTDFMDTISAHAAIHADLPLINTAKASDSNGIYYRQPLRAALLVCKSKPCLDDDGHLAVDPSGILLNTPVDVPQLGALAVLPLQNGPFQNNSVSASFAESGSLTKVTYKSNAAAAKAAEVFEGSADLVLKYKDAKRLQESTKLDVSASELESRKKVVDAQLALEKSQSDLDAFRKSQTKAGE